MKLMAATTASLVLFSLSLLLLTTRGARAASEKSCKAKANKAVERYVRCYLRAEGRKKAAKRFSGFRACLKTFKRKYGKVSGCKKVVPKFSEVATSLNANCLELGYDGDTCIRDAATLIARDVVCCDPDDFVLCLIGTAECCSDGQYSCPNGMTTTTTEYLCGGEVVDSTNPDDAAAFGRECRVGCTRELRICPHGERGSGRDGQRDCNFTPCCCDPQQEPGKFDNPIGREGYVCCPNGEWTTNSLGDGRTFFCSDSDEGTTGPFGRRCPS